MYKRQLHGNAKSDEEIALAVEHGIGLVVVDNSDDVDRLEATVPDGQTQDVLVRIIPGVTADTHAHVLTGHEGSKFGLVPADAEPLIRRIEQSSRLRMQGLHVHVQALHPQSGALLDAPDERLRVCRDKSELGSLVAREHVGVRVGGDSRDDPHQHVLGLTVRNGGLEPVDVVRVVDDHQSYPVLDGECDLLVALGVAVQLSLIHI